MNMEKKFQINTQHVVHDTIEGETILVNLKNGNYYSFDQFGVLLWEILVNQGDMQILIAMLADKYSIPVDDCKDAILAFIKQLVQEELIIPFNESATADLQIDATGIADLLNQMPASFEIPLLHKYENLQDMLFLDPIHDTDEKGWPAGIID